MSKCNTPIIVLTMASTDDLGGSLDVDVVGLVDLDFKSESVFFDFDSGGEFGLFGEAGVALHTTATTTSSNQSISTTSHGTTSTGVSGGSSQITSVSSKTKRSGSGRKTNTHWSRIEKDMFQKGLDLFGPDWRKISNFITTKTTGQVRSYYKKWAETSNVVEEPESITNTYVFLPSEPVCVSTGLEDPLGLVETATTTVTTTPLSPRRSKVIDRNVQATVSGIEADCGEFTSSELFVPSVAEEWVIESDDVTSWTDTNNWKSNRDVKQKTKPSKKKNKSTCGSEAPFNIKSQKHSRKKKKLKFSIGSNNSERENQVQEEYIGKKDGHNNSRNIAPMPDLGQIVHLVRDEWEESDVDIDVSDDEELMIVDKVSDTSVGEKVEERNYSNHSVESNDETHTAVKDIKLESKKQQVFSFPAPTEEKEIDSEVVTEEEKQVHFEYFEGRGVKTPERYLKIRNYILNHWKQVKPKYMRKTVVRAGLKNCGDVNSIGKIHEYLEKIGAINFGCPESNYTSTLIVGGKQKERVPLPNKPLPKIDRSDMSRQKQKKKWDVSISKGGGLTISHDESGAVVDACHIPEAPRNRVGPGVGQSGRKLEQFKLVRCLDYDPDTPAPFSVVMHAHALITLDLHAHTSFAEIMGLLGGYYDPVAQTLHVTVAVPTRAVSSGVECDMCPISQSAACTAIHEGGVQVVGWYHSHPTFPPNPSVQDIETQSQMQQWFARQDAPFLGIIISPFCPTNRGEASQIRCIVLDKPPHVSSAKEGVEPSSTPYKLVWSVSEVIPGAWEEVCQKVRAVVAGARDDPMAVKWRKEWRRELTNWEKAITSLNHHLPVHLHEPLQSVRTTFLAAVLEYQQT